MLAAGGSALDVVVAAVRVLEDDEEFNAGRGSVLTSAGTVEMDAAVADGRRRRLGGVGAVSGVRNPVELARAVLEEGSNVLVVGEAAAAWADRLGLAREPPEYFSTERRRRQLGEGTVGAVARDAHGHLAAATSTGGRTAKVPGRVGDSPIAGAGTWAHDSSCAVSATGNGEAILLAAFAHEVDARLRLGDSELDDACRAALATVERRGGRAGCIALSARGELAMPFTTEGMFRAWAGEDGHFHVADPRRPDQGR